MTKQKTSQQIIEPKTDQKVADYVELLMRQTHDLLSAVKTGGATVIVSLEDFIEALKTKLKEERDEYRAIRYSRPPRREARVVAISTLSPTPEPADQLSGTKSATKTNKARQRAHHGRH